MVILATMSMKACRVISQNCFLRCSRQVTACSVQVFQTSHLSMSKQAARQGTLSQKSGEALVNQNVPMNMIGGSSRNLHVTRHLWQPKDGSESSHTSQPPTSTHVFRFKSQVPSDPNSGGWFSFFSLRSLLSTPGPYMLYGLGGLIPFMSAPYFMYLTGEYSPAIAQAQLVYGATILSFLGGVSWGHHLNRSEKASLQSLSYSILLPLVAWPAVLLYPNPSSFLLMIGGITYAGVKDTRNAVYPRWFKNLRFLLTSLVAISLSTTLVFSLTMESQGGSSTDGDKEDDTD